MIQYTSQDIYKFINTYFKQGFPSVWFYIFLVAFRWPYYIFFLHFCRITFIWNKLNLLKVFSDNERNMRLYFIVLFNPAKLQKQFEIVTKYLSLWTTYTRKGVFIGYYHVTYIHLSDLFPVISRNLLIQNLVHQFLFALLKWIL